MCLDGLRHHGLWTFIYSLRQPIDGMPQVGNRLLEVADAVSELDENDQSDENDDPEEEHHVPVGSRCSRRAQPRWSRRLVQDAPPASTVTLPTSPAATYALGVSDRQAEV